MDPVTHGIIGLAVSKLAGNEVSLSDASTLCLVVGSVFPDIDIVFQRWGDYAYLKNHRGMTHSLVGLCVSSILIGCTASLIFSGVNFLGLILWALLGGLSHTFFDLFNSYGAKLLWPMVNKKYSIDLMNPVDPLFTVPLAGWVFMSGDIRNICMYLFILYPTVRFILRLAASRQIRKVFGETSNKIRLLPSMTGLFRWHFVLEKDNCNIVGEKAMFRRKIKIIQKLNKMQDEILEKVHFTHVGKMFLEFTPICHVISEKIGSITRYVLIDMRYYTGNDFLHHAVLEVDENDLIVSSSFNAYSINRVSNIPVPYEKPNTLFSRFVGF